MTARKRRVLISAGSILVAMVAAWLWWRAFEVTPDNLNAMLAGLRLGWLPVIFVLLAIHVALSAWRWADIEVCLGGQRPAFHIAFTSGAIAMGLGTFLPAPVMNVACRSLANRFAGASGSRGAVSGTVDQLSDFVVSAWLAVPAALAMWQNDVRIYFWGIPVMIMAGFAGIFPLMRAKPLLQRYWPLDSKGWIVLLLSRTALFRIYAIALLRLANLTLITIAVHFASGAASPSALAVAVPLVTVATAVAMLPGSIGAAEWSFSAVLRHLGVAPHAIINFVLANRVLLTALPLVLALLTLVLRSERQVAVQTVDDRANDVPLARPKQPFDK